MLKSRDFPYFFYGKKIGVVPLFYINSEYIALIGVILPDLIS